VPPAVCGLNFIPGRAGDDHETRPFMIDENPIPPFSELSRFPEDREKKLLQSYRLMPDHIAEHKGFETKVQAGGYGYRQILELVQNGADAIIEELESGPIPELSSRIDVVLSRRHL
jgi:hypothetical protein